MLGLGDFWVSLIFLLTILSAILCVVYGIVYWNKDGEPTSVEIEEEKKWDKEEKEIEDTL
ncbi:hypothetical protein KAS50_03085 [bacterium]|nr:hypothetical protein [bacterium]